LKKGKEDKKRLPKNTVFRHLSDLTGKCFGSMHYQSEKVWRYFLWSTVRLPMTQPQPLC